MVYVTVKLAPIYRQMSIEELLFENFKSPVLITSNISNTRTYEVDRISDACLNQVSTTKLIQKLVDFNRSVEHLFLQDRASLYRTFHIPKKSGGLRRIDAPNPELMDALRRLKTIFETDFRVLHHTSAFAYVEKRCTVDAIKRHQLNSSRWFAKLDFKNFFGNTTLDFVMSMITQIFPFCEVDKSLYGREELRKALSLAFLNGGLPQGTPISPLITNTTMVPIDHKLTKIFRDFNNQRFVYTRYADDLLISSRYDFKIADVEQEVVKVLKEFGAPFMLNKAKTRYGSSSGSNWNLGLMLNKDNEITIGRKKKRNFQAMLFNYVSDKRNGILWPIEDIRTALGLHSYYRMVEPQNIDAMVEHINSKLKTDVIRMMKDELQ